MTKAQTKQYSKLMYRIIACAVLLIIAVFLAFSAITNMQQSAAIRSDIERNMKIIGSLASNSITNWFTGRLKLTEELADRISRDPASIHDTFLDSKVLKEQFLFTYFGNAEGVHFVSPRHELPPGFDPRKRPWYQAADKAGSPILTPPYLDVGTNELVIAAAVPVYTAGTLQGVVGTDFSLKNLIAEINGINFGGMGYVFILDEDNTIVLHPDLKLVGKKWSDISASAMFSTNENMTEVVVGDQAMLVSSVDIKGLPAVKWRLAMVIDPAKAFAPIEQFRIIAIVATVIASLVTILLLALLLGRGVSRPLTRMTRAMNNLAAGKLDTPVPYLDRKDEIGAMAAAMEIFKEHAIERQALELHKQKESEARQRRAETVETLLSGFRNDMIEVLNLMGQSSQSLETTARSLNATAESSTQNVTIVSAAAEEASANVRNVASASEELAASIGEISRRVGESRVVADRAYSAVHETDTTAQKLVSASERISEIVALISTIAQQTNLLALNATIEAARAGESGKGFTVVAAEVKSLANQTAKATQEIASQIEAIQNVSQTAVEAIGKVGKVIGELGSIFSDISSAVEQQGLATNEIAGSVHQAAIGTQEVSSKMLDISQGASETGTDAALVLGSATDLAHKATDVRQKVERFFDNIRAA